MTILKLILPIYVRILSGSWLGGHWCQLFIFFFTIDQLPGGLGSRFATLGSSSAQGEGVLDPQMDTGVPPRRHEGRGCGWGCENRQKPYPYGCNFFLKSAPYGCKICKKCTFKRLFLTNFDFSVLIFTKIVKIPPLWVEKSAKPYPHWCFQGL